MSSIVRSQPNSIKKKFHQMLLYLLNVEFMFESKKGHVEIHEKGMRWITTQNILIKSFPFFSLCFKIRNLQFIENAIFFLSLLAQ